jgi:carbonic anhydrase
MEKIFVAVINCMDGRIQKPVIEYLQENYNADHVDLITEPGPNKILAEATDHQVVENIKKRVDISVNKHLAKTLAVTGHYDCAGNPVDEIIQKEQTKKAAAVLSSWYPELKIVTLWIDSNWQVEEY